MCRSVSGCFLSGRRFWYGAQGGTSGGSIATCDGYGLRSPFWFLFVDVDLINFRGGWKRKTNKAGSKNTIAAGAATSPTQPCWTPPFVLTHLPPCSFQHLHLSKNKTQMLPVVLKRARLFGFHRFVART